MAGTPDYFEQAADALQRAMKAATLDEQGRMLEEALRLNRLALAEERAKLAATNGHRPSQG